MFVRIPLRGQLLQIKNKNKKLLQIENKKLRGQLFLS